MADYTTYGKYIPSRKQQFSEQDAGRQVRPAGISFPNMMPSNFSPKLLSNPQKQNSIFVGDPMILQRKFMVAPCKADNASSQRFSQINGIYAQPYNINPIDPLSALGINEHDRLGPLGIADFSQRPFYQSSMY
jgi:hypothetical protein